MLLLGSLNGLVCAGLLTESLISISQFLLNHAAGAVSLLKEGARFFQSILVRVSLALSIDKLIMSMLLCSLLLLQLGLCLSQGELVVLDGALCLSIGSVCVLKVAIKIKNISFELFLHSQCLCLTLRLSLNS